MQVQVRYFAAAKAATGVAEETRPIGDSHTIGALLDELGDNPRAVFARCSFILNEVSTTDRDIVLKDGDRLDVLPPFAGG
ncbi:Molybdopterin converting factor, small subunit [Agreia sp. VKM Ac-1783]|nr:Molybdopterin converting factor, small subunit [Agreia sp. VKM Ac-1783]